jgi:hypothetical protein
MLMGSKMIPSPKTSLRRLSACRRDLLKHGIDVDRLDPTGLVGLVSSQLDYFQLMLGYDITPQAIVRLVRKSAVAR